MSRRKKGLSNFIGCVVAVGLLYYFVFSSAAILKNASHYRGYTVQVSEDTVPIDLFIEPQMNRERSEF